MSASESPNEILERLRRERDFDAQKRASRSLPPPPTAPPHLLPKRRPTPQPPPARRRPKSSYHHPINSWRWDPRRAAWLGRCPVCRTHFRAGPETVAQLETAAAEWASQHPV